MRMLEDKSVSKKERIMVLALNSNPLILALAGFLTSMVVFAGVVALLALFAPRGAAPGAQDPLALILPTPQVIYFGVFLAVFGALTARLKTIQYAMIRAATRGRAIYDVVAGSLNIVFPLAIAAFIFIVLVSSPLVGPEQATAWNTAILYLVAAGLSTMIIKQLWDTVFSKILFQITNIDWRLIIDKERFSHTLRLRFDESKRYPGPFTLMLIGVKDFDSIFKKVKKKYVIEMQERIIQFINKSVRTVDIVARLEQGQYIGVLMHTSAVEAEIPAQRILEQGKEFSLHISRSELAPKFRFGIAAFDQMMQHERELYEKAMAALNNTTDEKPFNHQA